MTDPVRALTQDEIKNHIKSDYERRVARWLINNLVSRADINHTMANGYTEEQARRLILANQLRHGPAGRMFEKAVDTIQNARGADVEAVLPDGSVKTRPSISLNGEPRAVDGGDIFDADRALWRDIVSQLQNGWRDAANDKGGKA